MNSDLIEQILEVLNELNIKDYRIQPALQKQWKNRVYTYHTTNDVREAIEGEEISTKLARKVLDVVVHHIDADEGISRHSFRYYYQRLIDELESGKLKYSNYIDDEKEIEGSQSYWDDRSMEEDEDDEDEDVE